MKDGSILSASFCLPSGSPLCDRFEDRPAAPLKPAGPFRALHVGLRPARSHDQWEIRRRRLHVQVGRVTEMCAQVFADRIAELEDAGRRSNLMTCTA